MTHDPPVIVTFLACLLSPLPLFHFLRSLLLFRTMKGTPPPILELPVCVCRHVLYTYVYYTVHRNVCNLANDGSYTKRLPGMNEVYEWVNDRTLRAHKTSLNSIKIQNKLVGINHWWTFAIVWWGCRYRKWSQSWCCHCHGIFNRFAMDIYFRPWCVAMTTTSSDWTFWVSWFLCNVAAAVGHLGQ